MEHFTEQQLYELDELISQFARRYDFSPITITVMVGVIHRAQHHALEYMAREAVRDNAKSN